MYHIGEIIYGLNKKQILKWIDETDESIMWEEAVGCDVINNSYCGVDHDTEWLGHELDGFDVIHTVELQNYHEQVKDNQEIWESYMASIRKALDYWLEEEDIDQARYDQLLAEVPQPKIQIIWSTS